MYSYQYKYNVNHNRFEPRMVYTPPPPPQPQIIYPEPEPQKEVGYKKIGGVKKVQDVNKIVGNIKDMDNEKSPMDILNLFGKANSFLLNSMEFNTGKSDFGIDDLLPLQIFIMIKAVQLFYPLNLLAYYPVLINNLQLMN